MKRIVRVKKIRGARHAQTAGLRAGADCFLAPLSMGREIEHLVIFTSSHACDYAAANLTRVQGVGVRL